MHFHKHTMKHCCFNISRPQYKKTLVILDYILTRHYVFVARNTTFEEVSIKLYEYFVSKNPLYRCVDGFIKDEISFSDNKQYGRTFSIEIKTSIFYLESNIANNRYLYVKEITSGEVI